MTNDTENLRAITVRRALRMLDAAGAVYAVQYEGETHGTLTVIDPKQPRAERYARGETRAHYQPYIDCMAPGDSAAIPFGDFDPKVLSSNLCAALFRAWGAGSFATHRNDAKAVVEVLRIS
jgi:hypothetical protein